MSRKRSKAHRRKIVTVLGTTSALALTQLGHAADAGMIPGMQTALQGFKPKRDSGPSPLSSARFAAMLGRRDQVFAIGAVTLSAKLAKCDGPVNRSEIDAFKRAFVRGVTKPALKLGGYLQQRIVGDAQLPNAGLCKTALFDFRQVLETRHRRASLAPR